MDWEDQFLHSFPSTDIRVLGSFEVIISQILLLKITDSRFPFIIAIQDLASLLLKIPGFQPLKKPIPRS